MNISLFISLNICFGCLKQGSYRFCKTNFPDISLTPIQISLTLPYSPEKLGFIQTFVYSYSFKLFLNLSDYFELCKFLLKLFSGCMVNNYVFDKFFYRLSHYYMLKTAVFFQKFGSLPLNLISSTVSHNATIIRRKQFSRMWNISL